MSSLFSYFRGNKYIITRDIHYVDIVSRNTWDFCQLLDNKFIKSKNGFDKWLILAKKYEWIKQD